MNNLIDSFSNYDFPLFERGVRLPEVKITKEDKKSIGLEESASNQSYLKKLCWVKCLERIQSGQIKQTKEECAERLKMEFSVFEKTNTIDYILLLMDIYLWCDNNDVLRGPARGSAAASFTLFCLGLTRMVNPLDYDLNFTRFLSEARAKVKYYDSVAYVDGRSMCDFDGDLEYFGREKCLKRVAEVYQGQTCKILTLQYLTGKTALKDTVKSLLEYNEQEALSISGEIESIFGKVDSLDKTYEKSAKFKEWADSPSNKEAYAISKQMEGLCRGAGIHASGILLTYHKIEDSIPTELSATGEEVSGFDMSICLTLSVKCDILGLRTLTQLDYVSKLTGIKCDDIDVNDKSIYDYYLKESKCFYGLFQIEDGITKEATLKIKPKNIEQLAIVVAISRPGGMRHIDAMAKFTNTGEYKSFYPSIDTILSKTGSIILFQEQINDICQKVYGLSPTDSDEVRRAIGKKSKKDMEKWEPLVTKNGLDKGIPEQVTKEFWQTCIDASDYLFNKAHAVSYSYLTAYTTYFKANYPLEFFLSCLKIAKHEQDPIGCIAKIQSELNLFSIKLLPPNLALNSEDFTIDGSNIRFGLSSIRGVSGKNLLKIKSFRPENANRVELFESFILAKLPINVVTPLILSGCVAQIDTKETRSKLLLQYELYTLLTDKEKLSVHKLAERYNYDVLLTVKHMSETHKDEKGNFLIKPSRFATILKHYAPFKEKYLRNSQWDALTSIVAENEYLGFNYSNTLKTIYSTQIDDLLNSKELGELPPDNKGIGVFIVEETEKRVSKNGNVYIKVTAKDEVGIINMMMFREDRINAMNKNNGGELVFGNIIVAHVLHKEGGTFFADNIIKQDCPVVLKKSKIEKELAAEQI